jgi:[ribosomal protein S18]-alanine N-acetyltransferase
MTKADVPAVVRIERESFSAPWRRDTFLSLVEFGGMELWVADLPSGEVVAYAIFSLVEDQAELANIAVREDHRGRGIGALLLDQVIEKAAESGAAELFLEVRESNMPALSLYHSRGFEEVGRRRRYYHDPVEDARVLVKRISA